MTGGFKVGDRVASPNMRTGHVTKVRKAGGREWVTMRFDESFRPEREFPANAVRMLGRRS